MSYQIVDFFSHDFFESPTVISFSILLFASPTVSNFAISLFALLSVVILAAQSSVCLR